MAFMPDHLLQRLYAEISIDYGQMGESLCRTRSRNRHEGFKKIMTTQTVKLIP